MSEEISGKSRRGVLKSIGAAGALSLGAVGTTSGLSDAEDIRQYGDVREQSEVDRTVRIAANGRAQYDFSVTGLVEATDAPADAVSSGSVSGVVEGATDVFSFTGEFTDFSVEGDAEVRVDGEPFDVEAFPQNTLKIVPDEKASYDVSASGAVEVDEGENGPNPRRVTGRTSHPREISYAGELTYVDIAGDATLYRNGSEVTLEEATPSTTPHEITVTSKAADPLRVEVSRELVTASGDRFGTDEQALLSDGTTANYDGRLKSVEGPSGARLSFDRLKNEIVCEAPSSEPALITVETSNGLVVDNEARDVVKFSLSGGETATATPFGDLRRVQINDVAVQIQRDASPGATESAVLQASAEFERTDAYRRLKSVARGRVRHDAAGLAAQEIVTTSGESRRSVEYRLAESEGGEAFGEVSRADETRGVLSIRQAAGTVENASVRYEHLRSGTATTVDVVSLPTERDRGNGKLERERVTVVDPAVIDTDASDTGDAEDDEYGAELFANSLSPKPLSQTSLGEYEDQLTQEELRDQGFTGFLDDIRSLLESIGAPVVEAARLVWDIVKDNLGSIATTTTDLVVESPFLLVDFVTELKDADISWKAKLVYKIDIGAALILADLTFAGFFEELGSDYGCAGCIFLGVVVREGLITGISAGCAALTPALPAAVLCTAALPIILDYVAALTPFGDVKDELCDGDVIQEIDYC